MRARVITSVGVLLLATACGDDAAVAADTTLRPLTRAPLTTEESLSVLHPIQTATQELSPQKPQAMDQMLADGFGDTATGPGLAVLKRTLDDAPPPAAHAGGPQHHQDPARHADAGGVAELRRRLRSRACTRHRSLTHPPCSPPAADRQERLLGAEACRRPGPYQV
ncbi:MAG: hypothetical protein IPI67_39565 [Myxococcales bacterium]|nr:hypothetical protein [Myxococcales bacterium]